MMRWKRRTFWGRMTKEKVKGQRHTPMRYDNEFKRGKGRTIDNKVINGQRNERTNYTKVKNGFKQHQQHAKRNLFYSFCSTHKPTR